MSSKFSVSGHLQTIFLLFNRKCLLKVCVFVLGEVVKQILLCNVIHNRHLTIVELSSNKRIEYQMNDLKRERRPRTFSTIFVTIFETSTPFSVDKIYTVEFTQLNAATTCTTQWHYIIMVYHAVVNVLPHPSYHLRCLPFYFLTNGLLLR